MSDHEPMEKRDNVTSLLIILEKTSRRFSAMMIWGGLMSKIDMSGIPAGIWNGDMRARTPYCLLRSDNGPSKDDDHRLSQEQPLPGSIRWPAGADPCLTLLKKVNDLWWSGYQRSSLSLFGDDPHIELMWKYANEMLSSSYRFKRCLKKNLYLIPFGELLNCLSRTFSHRLFDLVSIGHFGSAVNSLHSSFLKVDMADIELILSL